MGRTSKVGEHPYQGLPGDETMHRVADTLEFLDRSIMGSTHSTPCLGFTNIGRDSEMLVDVDTEWPSNKAVMGAHTWVGLSALTTDTRLFTQSRCSCVTGSAAFTIRLEDAFQWEIRSRYDQDDAQTMTRPCYYTQENHTQSVPLVASLRLGLCHTSECLRVVLFNAYSAKLILNSPWPGQLVRVSVEFTVITYMVSATQEE